ncbi:MAG: hypothetical protein Q9226_004475 [Calogaya cf. arnoldii]
MSIGLRRLRRPEGASSATELPFQQLLNNKELGLIENPLRRIAEEHVIKFFKDFHQDNNLGRVVNITTLVRGARLARQEEIFLAQEIADRTLTEVEKTAIDKEKKTNIWTETRELKIILLICSLGSTLQGWTQGAIVAANQIWPWDLHLKSLSQGGSTQLTGPWQEIWAFSGTNAIVYFAASTVGAFLCDPLTEILTGRRGAIFVAALFTFVASIGEAFVHDWKALLAWRL